MYTVQCEKNYTYRRSTGWAPWDHTLVAIGLILSSLNRFSIFFTGFLGKFAVKSLLKIAPPCLHMLPHYLWNINVWKQAINDKLQNSVATYLRCVGVVNNQIKKGLLLSLSVKKIKSVNIWQSYKQERGCFVHFLRLLAACWPDAQTTRENHVLACNFVKYSPI